MKKNKTIQIHNKKRLQIDTKLSPLEVLTFLQDFQAVMNGDEGKRKLISIRVPEQLLKHFKEKAKKRGIAYQTQMVELMRQWLRNN